MPLNNVLDRILRPKILLKAARIGQNNYSRNRDLKRLIGAQKPPKPEHAVECLIRREVELEEARIVGNATYNVKLHIHVMAALLQEFYLYSKENQKT